MRDIVHFKGKSLCCDYVQYVWRSVTEYLLVGLLSNSRIKLLKSQPLFNNGGWWLDDYGLNFRGHWHWVRENSFGAGESPDLILCFYWKTGDTCTHLESFSCNGCSPCVSQRKFYTAQFVLSGYKICPDTSSMQFAFVTVYPLCCTYRCINYSVRNYWLILVFSTINLNWIATDHTIRDLFMYTSSIR